MADLFDYLVWRGDLSLRQAPFNDVDNLILCALAYVKLGGGGPVTIAQAAQGFSGQGNHLRLLDALASSPRFSSLLLSDHVDVLDPLEEKQFAALTISLGGGAAFVAFRGTDGTAVGWKEDLNMGFLPQVPAQRAAAEYLTAAGARFDSLRVGGHSKGGNLAVYAAAYCGEAARNKLVTVYNNDGPGFHSGVLASPGYLAIRARVRTFVPRDAVVGMLLDHEENYHVVRSNGIGLLQHDLHTWEVLGPGFVLEDEVSEGSRLVRDLSKKWMAVLGQ